MVAPDRDKLRRSFQLGRRPGRDVEPEVAPAADVAVGGDAAELLGFLQRRRGRFEAPPKVRVELPAAHVDQTAHGPLWRRELCYPADFVHGTALLARGRQLCGDRLAVLGKDEAYRQVEASRCLFLDTETTGLAGGAGTMVFAYGLGFFRGEQFVLEQTFLRDFGEEPAMLHHLAARLAEFPVPVTFVGKSYDRHRIHARLAVHKIQAPVLTPLHLDLYHLVRRAHSKMLPDARLRTMEQHLLGLQRHDDLPNSEAPAAFFDWIRDGTGPVDRVLEHNRLDVLSLVALLGVLVGR